MATTLDSILFGPLYASAAVRAYFTDEATVDGWLRVEAALALAQGEVGEIPAEAAERIAGAAQDVGAYDLGELAEGIAKTSHPLVPLIRALATHSGDEAGGWVHWGATTQDIVDTGMVLQVLPAIDHIDGQLVSAVRRAVDLAGEHAATVMPGRTHGQHAVPITFGLKAAIWADELLRARERLQRARSGIAYGQFSGAAGSLATMPQHGVAVREALCRRLGLKAPGVVWHSTRDRLRDLAHAITEIANAAERIGGEVVRHQATELGELSEAAGPEHVGSSTMPQKRNPFDSEYMMAAARMVRANASALTGATVHAFERDMAAWAVEWLALPQTLIIGGGVAERLTTVLTGLEVHVERMERNIEITRGAIMSEAAMMAAAESSGREHAHHLMTIATREAAASGVDLIDHLADHPERPLSDVELARLRDPRSHLGSIDAVIDDISRAVAERLPQEDRS